MRRQPIVGARHEQLEGAIEIGRIDIVARNHAYSWQLYDGTFGVSSFAYEGENAAYDLDLGTYTEDDLGPLGERRLQLLGQCIHSRCRCNRTADESDDLTGKHKIAEALLFNRLSYVHAKLLAQRNTVRHYIVAGLAISALNGFAH